MRNSFTAVIGFIMAAALSLVHSSACGADRGAVDAVLVMDSSGSMKKTDPQSLRIPAAKLFISLLGKEDRAGIVSFSDRGYPIVNMTKVDSEENKSRLFMAAERITSSGMYTNLHDALQTGLSMLSTDRRTDSTPFIIIMTDGMMDVGNPDEDSTLLRRIKEELAPMLREEGVKVYTIAFTGHSDRQLLEEISKDTGGFYNPALTDKDFHLVFTSIFESLKRPEMIPTGENSFLIDPSIKEVTVVATKGAPATQIELAAPDGNHYSYENKTTGVDWFSSDTFEMITIKNPVEGRWKILFSSADQNKAYIISDMILQTNFEQLYSTFGESHEVKLWLEKEGTTITEQDVLDKIDFSLELTGPGGKNTTLQPFSKADGIFVRNIAPFMAGNYRLKISARGKTFEREKTFVFNVADARESRLDILKKKEAHKKSEHKGGTDREGKEQSAGISWTSVILQFAAINFIVAMVAFLYFKRKKMVNIKRLGKAEAGKAGPGAEEESRPAEQTAEKAMDTGAFENNQHHTAETGEGEDQQEPQPPQEAKQTIRLDEQEGREEEHDKPEEVDEREPDVFSGGENKKTRDSAEQQAAAVVPPPPETRKDEGSDRKENALESKPPEEEGQGEDLDALWEDALNGQKEAETITGAPEEKGKENIPPVPDTESPGKRSAEPARD